MLANDTLTRVSWRARPRSFVALMGLYESNFIRLGWLAGSLDALAGSHRSTVAGDDPGQYAARLSWMHPANKISVITVEKI